MKTRKKLSEGEGRLQGKTLNREKEKRRRTESKARQEQWEKKFRIDLEVFSELEGVFADASKPMSMSLSEFDSLYYDHFIERKGAFDWVDSPGEREAFSETQVELAERCTEIAIRISCAVFPVYESEHLVRTPTRDYSLRWLQIKLGDLLSFGLLHWSGGYCSRVRDYLKIRPSIFHEPIDVLRWLCLRRHMPDAPYMEAFGRNRQSIIALGFDDILIRQIFEERLKEETALLRAAAPKFEKYLRETSSLRASVKNLERLGLAGSVKDEYTIRVVDMRKEQEWEFEKTVNQKELGEVLGKVARPFFICDFTKIRDDEPSLPWHVIYVNRDGRVKRLKSSDFSNSQLGGLRFLKVLFGNELQRSAGQAPELICSKADYRDDPLLPAKDFRHTKKFFESEKLKVDIGSSGSAFSGEDEGGLRSEQIVYPKYEYSLPFPIVSVR